MNSKLFLSLAILFTFFVSTGYTQTQMPPKMVPAAENYPGGKEAMYAFINQKAIYPPVAKRNRLQGECIVGFTINEDGTVSNFKVVKNIGGGAGEEAVRIAKLLKFNAIGYKLETTIPIIFKL